MEDDNENVPRGMPPGRKWLLIIVAVLLATVLVVIFTTSGGSEHQAKLMQNLQQQQQAQPAPPPTDITRTGVVIRRGKAYLNSATYFYLAIEFDNQGKKEVFTGFATGQSLEVPMVKVGDTVKFTTKVNQIEITGLFIDWSRRPELSKVEMKE